MKVLVIGFSKTGTKSLNAALRALGYSVYDSEDNVYFLSKEWMKIFTTGGTKEDFYKMYKDVDASMDIPACMFWEEILEAFPDTKLVFMKRKSPEDWLRSWENQAKSLAESYALKITPLLSPTAYRVVTTSQAVGRIVFSAPPRAFNSCYQGISPNVAKKRYKDHNDAIEMRAPKEQLLEFNLSEGWKPLCQFLEKPVPEIPFPHKNRNASLINDLMETSPIYAKIKQEIKISITLVVVLLAVGIFVLMKFI